MTNEFVLDCHSLEDTRRAGIALGRLAAPGLIIGLIGDLGAGKTTFTRALAEGLGVKDPRVVTSPTFILLQEYEGRLPLYHFDAYRLTSLEEFADLSADECLLGEGVSIVEWADRVREILPVPRIDIEITPIDATSRRLSARPIGGDHQGLIKEWLNRAT